jgi:outer membrane biosynthesis protein TonB
MKVYGSLSILFCLLLVPTIGRAQLFQWTDAQGNLHITDTPPPVPEKKQPSRAEAAPPVSQPAPQKKTSAKRRATVGQVQAEVRPLPNPTEAPRMSRDARSHSLLSGLSPSQATVTSSWQVYEGNSASTKAAVRRWKDEQGIDHFVDVLADARRHPGSS